MDHENNGKSMWLSTLDSAVNGLDVKVDKLLEGQIRLQEREIRVENLQQRINELEVNVTALSNQLIQNESEKTTREKMNKLWIGIYIAIGTIVATIFGPVIHRILGG